MPPRIAGLTVALTMSLVLIPAESRAQSLSFGSGWDTLGFAAIGVIGGGVVIGGLVSDGMVFHDLIGGHSVRRGPAIAGIVCWGFSSAVALSLSFTFLRTHDPDAEIIVAAVLSDLIALGSLSLSIYGFTRALPAAASSPTPPTPNPSSQRVMLQPIVVPTQRGLAPGVGLTFSL